MPRSRIIASLALLALVGAVVIAIALTTCRAGRSGPSSSPIQLSPSTPATATPTEVTDLVTRADAFLRSRTTTRTPSGSVAKPGQGRFAGVIVSWVAPEARSMEPTSYADVMVTTDGRVAQPPLVNGEFGLSTNGSPAPNEGAYLTDFREYARSVAESALDIKGSGSALSTARPFVSAYVIEYPWGFVTMAPGLGQQRLGHRAPGSTWLAFTPLNEAERQRLDGLDATQTAEAWLRSPTFAQQFWLSSYRRRLLMLKPNSLYGREGIGKDVGFEMTLSRSYLGAYELEPAYWEVHEFSVTPTELYGGTIIVGRQRPDSPWRVLDHGF